MRRRPTRRIAASIAAVVAAFTAVLAFSPGVAQATPTGCSAWTGYIDQGLYWAEGGYASCSGGSGHFRSFIYCTTTPRSPYGIYRYGFWLYTGQSESYTTCDDAHPFVIAAGYEAANW